MDKFMFILRGVSGCGKTTTANAIVKNSDGIVVSADDYFYKLGGGEYQFDGTQLHLAHKECIDKCITAMQNGVSKVVVANTNVRNKDVTFYMDLALEYGYMPIVMVLENRHGGKNLHGVPQEKLDEMQNTLRQNIILQ